MGDIKIAFWNLQNLFDTTLSEMASDFEFTPENGWDEATFNLKINNLAEVINLMHNGDGPDLLGVCEIENKNVMQKLISACNRNDYEIAHIDAPDIRGIDTSLVYSKNVFELIDEPKAHNVHLRYATRDIFQVNLRIKETGAELTVLVIHWPSRSRGEYLSEPYRLAVANSCGSIADGLLKYTKKEYMAMPDTQATLDTLNKRWNRNILIMGDFNDQPFNRSVLEELKASSGEDNLEEEVKKSSGRKTPDLKKYLQMQAYFYNCMWKFLNRKDEGTHYYSQSTNTMSVLDQFIISRGLYYGLQNLKMDQESVEIFKPGIMVSGRKKRPNDFDKKTKKGYSDHFPIQAVIKTS